MKKLKKSESTSEGQIYLYRWEYMRIYLFYLIKTSQLLVLKTFIYFWGKENKPSNGKTIVFLN